MGLDELNLKAEYVYNLILITILDYDKIYDDLLKNAIKYGMSVKEFFENNDFKIYYFYEEAYFEKLHDEKHIQGLYNFIAFNAVISNALMDSKQGGKPLEYPTQNLYDSYQRNIINQTQSNKITKQNVTPSNIGKALQQRLSECY